MHMPNENHKSAAKQSRYVDYLYPRLKQLYPIVHWLATIVTVVAFFVIVASAFRVTEPRDQLILAIGTAGILTVMAIAWVQYVTSQDILRTSRSAQPSPENMYYMARALVGVAKDDYVRNAFVHKDGSVEGRVTLTVRAIGQSLEAIDHMYKPDPLAPSQNNAVYLPLQPNEIPYENRKAQIKSELSHDGLQVVHEIRFDPPLGPGECFKFFDSNPLIQKSPPKTMAMSLNELKQRKLSSIASTGPFCEHSAIRISHPSNLLVSRMTFPEGFCPQSVRAEVWLGFGYVVNQQETTRLQKEHSLNMTKDSLGTTHIELRVSYPVIGNRYAILWLPPEV
jgi:hypothetical protein